jgi:hypothetical protein
VYLKWPRAMDVLDPGDFSDLTQEELEQPMKHHSPIVEIVFNLDVQRLISIIASFDKTDLLKKFDTFGTSVRL